MTIATPMRTCLGCHRPTQGARCERCAKDHIRAANARDERLKAAREDGWSKRFYGSVAWRRCRRAILADEPLCRRCFGEGVETIAVDVHHVEPASPESDRNYDPTNLVPLCKRCHTIEENSNRRTEYETIRTRIGGSKSCGPTA